MNRTSLPITEIQVIDRQRQDLGDIIELAESITQYGLIQPIVINQDKRLIAGGRRLAAHIHLKRETIEVVYRETLSEDQVYLLELEENVRRKDETWQERTTSIAKIHKVKRRLAALDGDQWGTRETAEMLGIKGHSNVHMALKVAALIEQGDKEILSAESFSDAWKNVIMRREEEAANALLESFRKQTSAPHEEQKTQALIAEFEEVQSTDNGLEQAKQKYYSNPHNPPDSFDAYWSAHTAEIESRRNTIYLSNRFHNIDCISFMLQEDNRERFDAIVTDIPYGIDMDMLNQQNPHGGMKDIVTVEVEHDVKENEELYKQFFPAAFQCLKDNKYLITWCDQMQFQLMYDIATNAGFKVQRWPITWVKTHPCMNQSANVNFTKTTEIAIVCRKGTCTLTKANIPSHIIASHDELKEQLGHPFVKPFAIWEHLINAVTIEGQSILEPFSGRGSGVISALRLKRNVTGCELNVAHFNALMQNIQTYYTSINPRSVFK